MCRIASLFLLQRLKGSMSGDARDFNNTETRAVIKFRRGLDGSVGIATRYGLDDAGVRIPVRARFSASVQTQPSVQWVRCLYQR